MGRSCGHVPCDEAKMQVDYLVIRGLKQEVGVTKRGIFLLTRLLPLLVE